MERDDLSDGAQTQPLAGSGSGSSFVEVVARSLAACLVQDGEPSAAASVGESYAVVDVTGVYDFTTVTSPQPVGSEADAQPLAGCDSQMALVALMTCTQ